MCHFIPAANSPLRQPLIHRTIYKCFSDPESCPLFVPTNDCIANVQKQHFKTIFFRTKVHFYFLQDKFTYMEVLLHGPTITVDSKKINE